MISHVIIAKFLQQGSCVFMFKMFIHKPTKYE